MTTGKHPLTWAITGVGVVLLILAGCGGSSGVQQAESAVDQQEYRKALSGIEQALEQDSANVGAYLLRAKALRGMADSTMAADEYKALHRRAWEAEEEALSFDRSLRKTVRDRRADVYDREIGRGEIAYNRANKNESQELYRRSISFFGAAGAVRPDSARPVLNEAFARLRVSQRKEVVPILEQYVERADTAAKKAYKVLGQLYLETDQPQQAVELLGQAVHTHPSDQELQSLRLSAYNRSGNAGQALKTYREQIAEKPNVATYRYNYGALLLEAERYADAISQLEKAVQIRPAHLESQYNLGAAYVNAALARDDSIAALEEEQVTVPDTVDKQEQIEALMQKRQSLFEEAIPPLERARKMGGVSSAIRRDACRALLVAYVQTNRPSRAAQVEGCTGFTKPDA